MSDTPYACVACQKFLPLGSAFCPSCGAEQPHSFDPMWVSERRLVTILFADLVSFTGASENADPEDVTDMLNQVFTRLMVECDREEGYLDKTVGDQMMVLFGVPRAHEDDPARAVRAAMGMQAAIEELAPMMRNKVGTVCKLHLGINTGLVVWGQLGPAGRTLPTVIGDAVNLASRLQQLSEPGRILVSEPVFLHTRRVFDYDALSPVSVKGKTDLIPVYTPLRLCQPARSRRRTTALTPFFERKSEIDRLNAYWTQALAGRLKTTLIFGDAGIGKSRLLAEFIEALDITGVERQPNVLHVVRETVSNGGYYPLAELLALAFGFAPGDTPLVKRRKIEDRAQILGLNGQEFLPRVGYLLGWYQDDDRLAQASQDLQRLERSAIQMAARFLLKQSSRRASLILLDDLHWADVRSVSSLEYLVDAIQAQAGLTSNTQLMLVIVARPSSEPRFQSIHPEDVITLPPLSEVGRRDLISSLLPGWGVPASLIDKLVQESGGNPFYLIEVVQGLVQSGQLVRRNGSWQLNRPVNQIDVPASVEGLVMTTLDILAPTARSVLQHASVVGLRFQRALLAEITPVSDLDGALEALQQRGLIAPIPGDEGDPAFSFTQRVVREVIYRSILRKTRRELHERIARLTEDRARQSQGDSKDGGLEALAYHYTSGGQSDNKTVTYNLLVGQGSLVRFEYDQAYHYLQSAWESLSEMADPDPKTLRSVAESLGDASLFSGDFAQAAICYQAVHDLSAHEQEDVATFHYKMGRLHLFQDDVTAAVEEYEKALDLLEADGSLANQIDAEMRLLFDRV